MRYNWLIFATALLTATGLPQRAAAQPTAFTYQGRLTENGTVANGTYDFRFSVFNSPSAGNITSIVLTKPAVAVSNGLFAVILDFQDLYLVESPHWLEVSARTNGGLGFSILVPRQPLTAVPGATWASVAREAEHVSDNGVSAESYRDASIFSFKIADAQVVKSLNGLRDNVVLAAGANVT